MSRPVVVADSGPLIALACCDQLGLLPAVFSAIHLPQVVLNETTADRSRRGAAQIAVFAQAHASVHANRDDDLYRKAASYLDEGEAQAMSLANALNCAVLMDELRGRRAAIRQGIPVFGVLGVLLRAKRISRIERVAPSLERMQANGYRLSPGLVAEALRIASESGS